MHQAEMEKKYSRDIPIFQAWGRYVTDRIIHLLGSEAAFVRVPPLPRTKTVDSLIGKAFYRGKPYADPYEEITDKVGTRFVVLLTDHIRAVAEVVQKCSSWDATMDRDFEEERGSNPTHFDYQSVHYIVRANENCQCGSVEVPLGTPCEVQIRTLLQHAYSELTHDTVYKPSVRRVPEVRRDLAKSMALIEVADDLFTTVNMTFKRATRETDDAMQKLDEIYSNVVGEEPQTNEIAGAFLLDELKEVWAGIDWTEVERFARENSIGNWIRDKRSDDFMYRQATVILIYFLAETASYAVTQKWPLLTTELDSIMADLGRVRPYS